MELDELVLAYAISVHKAQGSEFPCVVLPIVPRHTVLLQRNLVYTAITRARQLCVIVGSSSALGRAARTDHRQRRNSALSERLRLDVGAFADSQLC
jgi:exodeoxyribonuclease V alpha subunit